MKSENNNIRAFLNSEEGMRLLIESAKDYAIFTVDTERNVTTWNSGAELVLGYTEEEVIGKSGDLFFTPEDRERHAPQMEIQKAANTGRAEDERWHMRHNGSRFYGSGMVRPIYDEQRLIGFVKIMRDLTRQKKSDDALRESEARLKVTIDSATEYAIIALDINGHITSWSKGAELIFSYTEKEIKGKYIDIIFTPEDVAAGAAEKEMNTAAAEGKAEDERWHQRKDGSRFFMSGVMTPIIYDSTVAGFVKVARDMTVQRLQEQQKDDFIGVASHELKTPVTSIKAYTELLLNENNSTELKAKEGIIVKLDAQVDRLITSINALLDTTIISEGRLVLNTEEFDLNQLISECINHLQPVFQSHTIVFNKGNILPIIADRERIRQVIVNLTTNAIKYSPLANRIIIKTNMVDEGIETTVTDFGIGIASSIRNKIFERFFRMEHETSENFTGMGLGLYIAAGIIKEHKGTISVDCIEGERTIFRFVLPNKSNGDEIDTRGGR